MVYTRIFYGLTYLFRRLPIKPHFSPAIGAFSPGWSAWASIICFGAGQQVLSVLSFGYGIIQDAMNAPVNASLFSAVILLAVAVGKILTTGLTIGSGGSGGVFGPSMVIGGCGGGRLGSSSTGFRRGWCAIRPISSSSAWRLFRRRRQDAVLDARHRQRNDRQLQPAACRRSGCGGSPFFSPMNNRFTARRSIADRVPRPIRGLRP